MKEKITIGMLLDQKLITKRTEVRIGIGNLRELYLIKPIQKKKLVATTQLK